MHVDRANVFDVLPQVTAVRVSGAHALNFSHPDLIAHLIDAFVHGAPLRSPSGTTHTVEPIEIGPRPDANPAAGGVSQPEPARR